MSSLNARISVTITLDDGQSREFDLDYGTIAYSPDGDSAIVDVFDNSGELVSTTNRSLGGFNLAGRVSDWLAELGIAPK